MPLRISGPWTHVATGLEFPANVPGWARVALNRYDEESNNVGVGYGRRVGASFVAVTIYVFPRPWATRRRVMTLDDEFRDERGQIAQVFAVESEGDAVSGTATLRGARIEGRAVRILAKGPKPLTRDVHTFLTTYAWDPWRIKVRVTVAVADSDAARTATEALLATLHLPPLDPSAPPAADAAPPERK